MVAARLPAALSVPIDAGPTELNEDAILIP